MDEPLLESMRAELRKIAGPWTSMLGTAGALGGVGAAGGALLGAGVQGVKNYRAARAQGAETGDALRAGLGGAVGGATRGALLGGAAGLAGGAATGYLRPALGDKLRHAVDAVPGAHFGQRQVHALTGWEPEHGIGSIGLGKETKLQGISEARDNLARAQIGGDPRGMLQKGVDKVLGRSAVDRGNLELQRAKDAYEASAQAEKMKLTSIPGFLRSAKKDPVGTARAAFNDQWRGMSMPMKALTVGVPAAELVSAVGSKKDVDENGDSRGKRIGRSLASTAGGLLMSPMPFATQILAGSALGAGGGAIGGLLSRKPRGQLQSSPVSNNSDLTSESGQAVAGERHISDRANGSIGAEGMSA